MRVVIAGASGFIGKNFIESLSGSNDIQIRALSRKSDFKECTAGDWPSPHSAGTSIDISDAIDRTTMVSWRKCDLFSLKQAELALDGADIALFLVHSMMPSSRLVQAGFSEIDLLLADNFARAAQKSSLKRIIFLGGMIPSSGEKTSEHLRSRQEVENALARYGIPVRVLRAGIVLGGGGSSSEMVFHLVEKLPVMICPAWTRKISSPIYVDDVAEILKVLLFQDELPWPKVSEAEGSESRSDHGVVLFEANSGETVSYLGLLKETAAQMKRKTLFIPFPYVPPAVSALWVSLISGYSLSLVRPLVKSLEYDLVPKIASSVPRAPMHPAIHWRLAVTQALAARQKKRKASSFTQETLNRATSIQRIPCPVHWSATRVAEEYVDWLPKFFRPFLQVKRNKHLVSFYFALLKMPLLVLRYSDERSSIDRVLFYVEDGLLLKANSLSRGRLEFRKVNSGNELLAAVLDFEPSLPFRIYVFTQALAHLVVMFSFKRHLRSFL